MMKKTTIGELLLQDQVITMPQLEAALNSSSFPDAKDEEIFLHSGLIDHKTYLEYKARKLNIPFIDLTKYTIKYDIAIKLPESYARRFQAILLQGDDNGVLVGMTDPSDIFAIDELMRILRKPIKVALVDDKELNRCIDLTYRRTNEITDFAEKLGTELKAARQINNKEIINQSDTAIEKLIISLFEDAVQIGASDIHIEPGDNILRIRFRVDGILQEQIVESKDQHIANAVSQHLKLMAGLNIAEKRLPQDGGLSLTIHNTQIDVRLSTMPVQYGESIVMRLLLRVNSLLDLKATGMPDQMLSRFRKLIKNPHGIILVTGPTGSGKTTTLYSALSEINDITKNIITIEDPVEYRLDRVNQVQVNPQLGLTFARILKSILRQDPNIILVGEIRDQETASIALRCALTGQLVLATLHTNDAASAAIRLIDIGVEGYLVAATVRGVLSQRLARRICKNCCDKYNPTDQEMTFIESFSTKQSRQKVFSRGQGCPHCNYTGYHGRIGVFELLEFNKEMLECLRCNNTNNFLDVVARTRSTPILIHNALELAEQAIIPISEVLRLAGEQN